MMYELAERAENDFIYGKAEEAEIQNAETSGAEKINLDRYTNDLHAYIKDALADSFAKYAVLVSKSKLLDDKLEVDPTEATEHNIRISRTSSMEVLQNLSMLVSAVYENGLIQLQQMIGLRQTTGEKDATTVS